MPAEAHETLTALLIELFSTDELRALLRATTETLPLVADLPGANASQSAVTREAVELLRRHGLIDDALAELLVAQRPAQARRIREVMAELRATAGSSARGLARGDAAPSSGMVGPHSVVVRADGHDRAGRFAYQPHHKVAELHADVLSRWSLPSRALGQGPVTLRYRYLLYWDGRPLSLDETLGGLNLTEGATLRLQTRVEPKTDAELAEGALDGFSFWMDEDA